MPKPPRVTICPPMAAEGAETAEDWVRIMHYPRACICGHESTRHSKDGCSGIACDCKKFIQAG
jgi:hypothetical protein